MTTPEPAAEGVADPTQVKGQELGPEANNGLSGSTQSESQPPEGDPKPKKKPWSLRNLGLVQRITRKKPQSDETSEGERTPTKSLSKETTPQPHENSPQPESPEPAPGETEAGDRESSQKSTTDQAGHPSSASDGASSEDVAPAKEEDPSVPKDEASAKEDDTPAQVDDTSSSKDVAPVPKDTTPSTDHSELSGETHSAKDQPEPAAEAASAAPTQSSKELSPVQEESPSPTATAVDQTASSSSGSEPQPTEADSAASEAATKPAAGDVVAEVVEEPQSEGHTPVTVISEQTTSQDTAEAPEQSSDHFDSNERLPVSEISPRTAAGSRTPPPTPEDQPTSFPAQKDASPPPALNNRQTPPPDREEHQGSLVEHQSPPTTSETKMATSPPSALDSPATALTADTIDQSAVELPPQPTNQQTGVSQLNQMPLEELCRDIKQSFKLNSLGLQNRLTRLDDRMSAVERMQFLIRKQSEEMQDLKWRMAEAERRSKEDQKKVTLYRRKMKELQTSLQEMHVRESVRARAEKEVERRETERRRQQQQQPPPPSQIITLTQPMPIFLPSDGYNQNQQAYNGRRDSGYYQPMPPPQSSYQQQQQALPPPPPPPPASIVELPPERAQSPPPPPPPPSQPAASRRGSMFSVKSYKSNRKGVAAQ